MLVTIDSAYLIEAIKVLREFDSSRYAMARFSLAEGTLLVRTGYSDQSIEFRIPTLEGDQSYDLESLVNISELAKVKITTPTVTLRVLEDPDRLKLEFEDMTYIIGGINTAEFAPFIKWAPKGKLTTCEDLPKALIATAPCLSTDMVHHGWLRYVCIRDNVLICASGHRIATHPCKYKGELIVSGEVTKIAKFLKTPTIGTCDNFVYVEEGNMRVILLRGKSYHDIMRTLPLSFPSQIEVSKKALSQLLKGLPKSYAVQFEVSHQGDAVKVEAYGKVGKGKEAKTAQVAATQIALEGPATIAGESPFTVSFQTEFIRDVLRVCTKETKTITANFVSPRHPAHFVVDKTDIYLMPLLYV